MPRNDLPYPGSGRPGARMRSARGPSIARQRIRGAAAVTLWVLAAVLALLICDAARPEALQAQICIESSGPGTVEGADGTGSTTVNSTCPGSQAPPVISTEPHNGDHLQPARCVAGCFDASVGYSTPAYVVLDQPHSTELVYRSGQAQPRVLVQVDARDTSNVSPAKMSIRLRTSSNTWVTFTNGTQEIFYRYVGTNHNRLAAQFDASWLATGAYDYTVLVRSWWSDGTVHESSAPVRVLVVNEGNSDFGAGWSVAGLQRVHVQAAGSVLVTDGAGGAAYFHKACGTCGFTRPRGDFSTLTYDGSVYKRRYPDGTELVFAADGRLSHVRDRLNNQVNYAWLASGKLSYVSDALGGQTVFGYNASGRLASIRDPAGRYTYVTVNASGDLTHIKDPSNTFVLQATYDAQHRMITRTNAAGGVARFTYDAFGRLAADSLPAVALWDGRTVRPTVRYRSVESAVLPSSGGTSSNPASGVDGSAVRVSVTNPRDHATQIALDRWGAATRVEGPTGQVEAAFRNAEGQDTLVLTALGDSLRYAWSGPNLTRASSARTAIGHGSFWTYEPTYNQVVEASGSQTYRRYFYGSPGLPDSVKVGSSTARATRFTYDAFGRVTEEIDPELHKVVYAYAASGHRNLESVTTIDPMPAPPGTLPDDMVNDTVTRAVYSYDAYGRPRTVRNALGDTTRTEYDMLNRVVRTVGPRGDVTTFGHDALGLHTVTDARSQTYTYRRNPLGWVYEQVDPANAVQTFAFDENGNVRRYVNRRGQTATWEYDALDRETRQTADGRTRLTSYDQAAKRMVVQTPESTDSIQVDALGRTTEVVTRRGTLRYRTSAEYGPYGDNLGLKLESPFRSIGYQTSGGLLTGMTDLANGTTTPTYNGDRQTAAMQLPTGMQVSRQYGDEHRPRSITYNPALDTLGASYEYDLAGRLRQKSPGGTLQPYFYGYDAAGQLTSVSRGGVTLESFAYDMVGNPTDHGAVVTTGNRLTSFRGFTLQYDADGNLIRKLGNGVDQRFYWSTLGQLDSLQSGGTMYRYTYDGLGRRVRKNNPWDGVIDFVYWLDGDMLLQERLNATGAVLREYTYYPGIDQPHSFRDAAGNVFYYVTDELGSVVGAFNASNQVVNLYAYTAFGALTSSVQSAPGPLRYAAREHDAETGLYFNRARYYDPQLRRFISEDPIGLDGGMNLYAYTGNDPVNYRDPRGTIPCTTYWIHAGGLVNESFLVISDGCYQDEPSSFEWERLPMRAELGRGGRRASGQDGGSDAAEAGEESLLSEIWQCATDHYGFGSNDLHGVSYAGAAPVSKKLLGYRVLGDASRSTNVLNAVGHKLIGPVNIRGAAGRWAFRNLGSRSAVTLLGRTNVVLAWGFFAYDAISIGACAAKN